MQVHLELESFRPDAAPARRRTRPGTIDFNWRRWLHNGLADEATFMTVNWTPQRAVEDRVGAEMLEEARAAGVPVHLRYWVWGSRDGRAHADNLEYAYRTGQFAGCNLYETAAFYDMNRLDSAGRLSYYPGLLEALRERVQVLGLL
jgi:hypothetical protein